MPQLRDPCLFYHDACQLATDTFIAHIAPGLVSDSLRAVTHGPLNCAAGVAQAFLP